MATTPQADKLQRALQRLVDSGRDFEPFEPLPERGERPPTRSVGAPGGNPRRSSSGFVEADYLEREYWPAQEIESSDGIFTLEVEPIRSILLDSGERAEFAEPVEPEEEEES